MLWYADVDVCIADPTGAVIAAEEFCCKRSLGCAVELIAKSGPAAWPVVRVYGTHDRMCNFLYSWHDLLDKPCDYESLGLKQLRPEDLTN